MPMAGSGSRFVNAGFDIPKPYIPIFERKMFQVAFDSIGIADSHGSCCAVGSKGASLLAGVADFCLSS